MPTSSGQVVHLEFTGAFEMLDFVQLVTEHLARSVGLDDDARHWVSVAIRESVINAIKHGNQNDASKHVFVDLEASPGQSELAIRVRDEGEGFDPVEVADPLAPENLLKAIAKEAAEKLDDAQKAMKDSKNALAKNEPREAVTPQEKAKAELLEARNEIDKQIEKLQKIYMF